MIRLFTWEALAHGAEVVSYFRWRQAPFGQEQMHAGLNRPDRNLSEGGREAERVAAELKRIGKLPRSARADVALVYDYESAWVVGIQPQGADYSFNAIVHQWYSAARRLGLGIDVVPPGANLAGYKLVLVPCLPYVSDAALAAFESAGATILYGPRTGSKTRDFRIPETLPPGPLAKLVPMRVAEVGSLPPGLTTAVSGRLAGKVERWREHVESMAEIVARFADGKPAVIAGGKHVYVAGWPDAALRSALFAWAAKTAGLSTLDLPEGVRIRRRGDLTFAFNYGDVPWTPPVSRGFLLGGPNVDPQDVAAWE
jgi:beta-galactosidase